MFKENVTPDEWTLLRMHNLTTAIAVAKYIREENAKKRAGKPYNKKMLLLARRVNQSSESDKLLHHSGKRDKQKAKPWMVQANR